MKSCSEKFGMSNDTVRKIDTLRKWGLTPTTEWRDKNCDYLCVIADEMERIYGIMIERSKMGVPGQDTGLKDRHGTPICIGDKMRFDADQWGGELEFVVGWKDGELDIYGTVSDLSEWCEVIS